MQLTMFYGRECWMVEKEHVQKVSAAKVNMLRWMSGILRDKLRNKFILNRMG